MDVFAKMLTLQSQLFILILLGVLLAKLGVINGAGRKCLSALLIDPLLKSISVLIPVCLPEVPPRS